jgi:hypothetical protein
MGLPPAEIEKQNNGKSRFREEYQGFRFEMFIAIRKATEYINLEFRGDF